MESLYSPQSRAERLIAAGRVVLAASSLVAIWLAPSEPVRRPEVGYALLGAYLAYALLVAAWVSRSGTPPGQRGRVATLAVDLVFFSLFIAFTSGPASPFFAYFVFALVCAAMRWSWRGTMWTAGSALAAFLAVGFYRAATDPVGFVAIDELIIRAVYLGVVAVLVAYLGAHEREMRRDLAALGALPRGMPDERQALVEEVLGYAASTLGAPRVLLAWSRRGEADLHVALGAAAGPAAGEGGMEVDFASERRVDPASGPDPGLVAGALEGASFLCTELGAPAPRVVVRREAGFELWHGAPVPERLRERFDLDAVLSVPLGGQLVEGRLFFLDETRWTSDQLVLGEIVGGLVAARLDHLELLRRLREAAAGEERMRLSRDLHDGVLQTLTGIALRLEAMRRGAPAGGGSDGLAELQGTILQAQRDLRFFIEELRPKVGGPALSDLHARLAELEARSEREWGLEVEVDAAGFGTALPELLVREVYHLIREAVVNARRHGEATVVRVAVRSGEEGISLSVEDDGRGFPFHGEFTAEELLALRAGPRSLRERATALGGRLRLVSAESGARIEIDLPMPEGA